MKGAKIRAQKLREKAQEEKAREAQKLKANATRLKTLNAGFTLQGYTHPDPKALLARFKAPKVLRRVEQVVAPSTPDPVADIHTPRLRYEGQMLDRELKAQAETHEKKKLAMPLYNKGGLQYPTAEEIKAMQNGELRRRS